MNKDLFSELIMEELGKPHSQFMNAVNNNTENYQNKFILLD